CITTCCGPRPPSAVSETPRMLAPDFGQTYHVRGVISLPYAEIKEPFEAWVDMKRGRSRIDYYYGQVSTFQLALEKPSGISYKITPVTTETELNVMKCFQVNGTQEDPILPQGALPLTAAFQYVRTEYFEGVLCEVWQNVSEAEFKRNTYTLWVTRPEGGASVAAPVHYEMIGYNTLLGSHYDKYLLDYSDFRTSVQDKDFNRPDGLSCGPFPGPGVEHRLLANPMQDLLHTAPVGHAHRLFGHFKQQFGLGGGPGQDCEKNRAGLSYSLSLNHLADRSAAEVAVLRGSRTGTPNRGRPFPAELRSVSPPDSLDWRLYGAVTPVKDQAVCGSCWSFATTGALEGALFLKTGMLQVLSEQMLVDCTWGFGNNGCDGGEEWRAYEWLIKHGGIATTDQYGDYRGMNGFCHNNDSTATARVTSYTNVTSGDTEALKVAIDAAHRSFTFYSHGVYYEPACKNTPDDLDHAVLAVGYGVLDGQSYWLIKNSWSSYWGNAGFVLMSMKDNNCGVTTDATYVTLA
uniref:Peptidase C1A papain C-terminal domain-containing protein n=1 Tax=Denticeps clupeoides TaxID=299321 RepID=A0AAY4DXH4_9TELE